MNGMINEATIRIAPAKQHEVIAQPVGSPSCTIRNVDIFQLASGKHNIAIPMSTVNNYQFGLL
jgi:hypothetical protein